MAEVERFVKKAAYQRCARLADKYRDQYLNMARSLSDPQNRGPLAAAEACRVLREAFLEFSYEGQNKREQAPNKPTRNRRRRKSSGRGSEKRPDRPTSGRRRYTALKTREDHVTRRKPTRRDLLVVIGRLQDLVGKAVQAHGDDRNPDGFQQGMESLEVAHELCIEVRSHEPPVRDTGPWASALLDTRNATGGRGGGVGLRVPVRNGKLIHFTHSKEKSMRPKSVVGMVAREVGVIQSLNGRAYKGPNDGPDGGWPICEKCGEKARYVYSSGSVFMCYNCVAKESGA